MKAALRNPADGIGTLRIGEVSVPEPGPDEILVKIEAISIEVGDLLQRRRPARGTDDVIGYAAAGVVERVGQNVTTFRPGQKVTTFSYAGSHAEYRAVSAATSWHVPDGLDMRIAASIPVAAGTAALALQQGGLKEGQTVLVQGAAGGVGIAAVQIAAQAGARVIGSGTNSETLSQLRAYGLADAIVSGEDPVAQQVHDLIEGGVDLLVDTVGGPPLLDALAAVRAGGTAVLVGIAAGSASLDAVDILHRRLTIIGCILGVIMHEPEIRTMIDDLLVAARDRKIEVPIRATLSLDQIVDAHRLAETRGGFGRVFVLP